MHLSIKINLIKSLDYFLACLGNLTGLFVENFLTFFTLQLLVLELVKVKICFYIGDI